MISPQDPFNYKAAVIHYFSFIFNESNENI